MLLMDSTYREYYDNALLGQVVTLAEACEMWGKSRTAMVNQIEKGRIASRRAVSGGTRLLVVADIIDIYGKPKKFDVWEKYNA
jgi:hypothetical protein